MSQLASFEFFVKEDEQIDAKFKIAKERRSVIYGVVVDEQDCPIHDAVVKLLEVVEKKHEHEHEDKHEHDKKELKPVAHTFTNKCGQFLFGPLCPCKKYVVEIWKNNSKVRCEKFDEDFKGECLKPAHCDIVFRKDCEFEDEKDCKCKALCDFCEKCENEEVL